MATDIRRMCAYGEIADLIWEAPNDLAADHERAHDAAMVAYLAGDMELADQHWQQLGVIWSDAWAANCAALDFMQETGLDKCAAVRPQRWVVASFEHHRGPHGAQNPQVHNIVITALTTGVGKTVRVSGPEPE